MTMARGGGLPDIRTIASRVVYEDAWVRLRQDEIERGDGSRGTYAVVEKPDFALVIAAERGGFHLVQEFRYPIGMRAWAFPQGTFPHRRDGDPEALARLELAQETGLRAGSLTRLGCLSSAHGTSGQRVHVFLATGLTAGTPAREPEEQDMVHRWIPRPVVKDMIRDGALIDDASVAAYTLLLLHEERHGTAGEGD